MLVISMSVLISLGWAGIASAAILTPGNWIEAESDVTFSGNVNKESDGLNYYEFGRFGVTMEVQQEGYYKLVVGGKTTINAGALDLFKDGAALSRVYVGELGNWVLINGPMYLKPGKNQVHFNVLISFFIDWIALAPVNNPNDTPLMDVKGQPLSAHGTSVDASSVNDSFNWFYDPSFENSYENPNGNIERWGRFSDPPAGITVTYNDHTAALFGNSGLSVNNTTGEAIEIVQYNDTGYDSNVLAEMPWGFSGWVKCETQEQMNFTFSTLFFSGDWQTYAGQKNFSFTFGNSDWQYVSGVISAEEMSKTTDHFIFQIKVEGVGKMSLDGFAFHPITNANWEQPEAGLPLQITEIGSDLQLTWTAQENNLSYEIHRGATPDFEMTSATRIAQVTETSWVDSQSDISELAYYKVRGINKSYRPAVTRAQANDIYPPNAIAAAPVVDNKVGGILIVSWKAPAPAIDGEKAAKYLVYRAEAPSQVANGQLVATIAAVLGQDDYSWRDLEVTASETYYYGIVCEDRVGLRSNLSAIPSGTTVLPDTEPPNAPNNPSADANDIWGAVLLKWEQPAPAAEDKDLPESYKIFRSSKPVMDYSEATEIDVIDKDTFEYLDINVVPQQTYYYYVVSLDKVGNPAASAEIVVTVKEPSSPKALEPASNQLVLSTAAKFAWEAPQIECNDQVDFYILEYGQNSNFENAVKISNIRDTQYTLPVGQVLSAGIYYWRVSVQYKSKVVSKPTEAFSFEVAGTGDADFPVPYFNIIPQIISSENVTFSYIMENDGWVSVNVYDQRGRLVKTFINRQWQTSKENNAYKIYDFEWDLKDAKGNQLADGLYIAQLIFQENSKRPLVIRKRFQVFRGE